MKKPIALIIGTRPDAIKLVPLYKALKGRGLSVLLCATNQHDILLNQVLTLFDVQPDISLHVMKENQQLDSLTNLVLQKTGDLFAAIKPGLVIVQGDTTSSFGAALAAFYQQIPIAHVEAGLRTGDMYAPFPEEINRTFISRIASFHFAPTPANVLTLLHEGVDHNRVFCVGNTVVDALYTIKERIENEQITISQELKNTVEHCRREKKRIVLFTMHRRESFGGGVQRVLNAIAHCANTHKDLAIFFPVHPNPQIKNAVEACALSKLNNVFCIPPLSYQDLLFLLLSAEWVVSDSGGIQEEAVSLGKRVIILRTLTERIEAVWEGVGKLVGTDEQAIITLMNEWYEQSHSVSPRFVYGDGKASERIVALLLQHVSSLGTTERLTTPGIQHRRLTSFVGIAP